MPRWQNQPVVTFHGTDTDALDRQVLSVGATLSNFTVELSRCRPDSDFGRGFYVTTNVLQAREWANARVRRTRHTVGGSADAKAVVLSFRIDLDALASQETLCFVRASAPFFAFVAECRRGAPAHRRAGPKPGYDVVFGPVRMWPQRLVIQDSDQWGFHTPAALAILNQPVVQALATRASGLL